MKETTIVLEDELSYLEGVTENLSTAKKNYLSARDYLETFERKVRKHAYEEMIKQSNAQKMQLAFEHVIAKNEENWNLWVGLTEKKNEAERKLEEAKVDWECALNRVQLIINRD